MDADPIAIIKEYIHDYAIPPSYGDVDIELIFNEETGHYQLMQQGWDGFERVHSTLIHIDYRDGKVYVQHDGTEEGVATRLVEAGFPPKRIVLCYHAPRDRQYTPFGLG